MTLDSIKLRIASPQDRAAMIPLINAAFAIETFLKGTRTDEARLAELMNTGTFLLGFSGDQLAASVYVELRDNHSGYLGMLATDPAFQGRGLGRLMVGAAEDHCRRAGCSTMKLTVLSLRPDLPPFYDKLGYNVIGSEPFQPSRTLQPGMACHGIVMSKEL